jgi:hypothetical protein
MLDGRHRRYGDSALELYHLDTRDMDRLISAGTLAWIDAASPEEKGAHVSPRDVGKRGRGKMLFLAWVGLPSYLCRPCIVCA